MQIPHPRMRRPRAAAIPYLCRASKAALMPDPRAQLEGPYQLPKIVLERSQPERKVPS